MNKFWDIAEPSIGLGFCLGLAVMWATQEKWLGAVCAIVLSATSGYRLWREWQKHG